MSLLSKFFPRRFAASSIADHLGGIWAVSPKHMDLLVHEAISRAAALTGTEVRALMAEAEKIRALSPVSTGGYAAAMDGDGTLRISVNGIITNQDPTCARLMGMTLCWTKEIMQALAYAAASPDVLRVALDVDSPGGTVSGTPEVAVAIRELRGIKSVTSYVTNQASSAGYWIAAAADKIEAQPSATLGCLGAYIVVEDASKAFEAAGIKVNVLRSGPFKGTGVDGDPVTPGMLAKLQENVDTCTAMFAASVAKNRGLSADAVAKLFTGESWFASDAKALGLVDRVVSPSISAPSPSLIAPTNVPTVPTVPGAQAETPAPSRNVAPMPKSVAELERKLEAAKQSKDETKKALKAAVASSAAPAVIQELEQKHSEAKEQKSAVKEALVEARAKEELAEAKAQAKMAELAFGDLKVNAIAAVINRHVDAGRIRPADRAGFERAAQAYEDKPEALDKWLSGLPVQTRSSAKGTTGVQQIPDFSPELTTVDSSVTAEEQAAFAKRNRLDPAKLQAAAHLHVITFEDSADPYKSTVGALDTSGQPINFEKAE